MERSDLRPGRKALHFCSAVLVFTVACSGSKPSNRGPSIDVTLKDFAIQAPAAVTTGASLTFDVYNRGPATHEFVVVRTDLPADRLPIGPDGLTVDEDALRGIGELSEVNAWTTQSLTVTLPPGRYVFFCNLEGHYLGGMHTSLVVSP